MQFKVYYLKFNAPLHLGNHRPDTYDVTETYIRSDTIVAAVYDTWAKIGKAEWIPDNGIPSFTLSSAFPYVEHDGKKAHFFPRPKMRFNQAKEVDEVRKSIKKVMWLDQFYFEKVINQESIDFEKGNSHLKGSYLAKNVDPTDHITKDGRQRVEISRQSIDQEDSRPFYMEFIFFQNAGLYFLADQEDEQLKKALDILQYEGFGTDRTVGNGLFTLEEGTIDVRIPGDTETSTNLSLYTPKDADDFREYSDHQDAAYDTIKRGGWITSTGLIGKEKKSVRMFTEGSIWHHREAINGKANINLRPSSLESASHPIWRSGRSLFLPIKTSNS